MSEGHDLADLAIAIALFSIAVLWPIRGIVAALNWASVGPGETGLVYRFGRFRGALPPGRHVLWPGATMRRVTLTPQTLHVTGFECTSQDGWTVVLSALVTFRVAEGAARAVLEDDVLSPVERVRHVVQLALCELADRTDLVDLVGSRAEHDAGLAAAIEEVGLGPRLLILRARVSRVRFNPLARRYLARLALDPAPRDV